MGRNKPEMPFNVSDLEAHFGHAVVTERTTIQLLHKFSPEDILTLLQKTAGLGKKAENTLEEDFTSCIPSNTWKTNMAFCKDNAGGLDIIQEDILPSLRKHSNQRLLFGIKAHQEQELVGITEARFDQRKWLRFAPYINPDFRQKGYAKEIYQSMGEALGDTFSNAAIHAVILHSNKASNALFQSMAYDELGLTALNGYPEDRAGNGYQRHF